MSIRQGSTIVAGISSSNYNDLSNKPQINSIELSGNKTLDELSIQSKLVAGENITIEENKISATGLAKTDLSNVSSNIDYVVESQEPTAENGYTWYRKYKSGWVEQGGIQEITIPSETSTVRQGISLPIEMTNANYNTQLTQEQIVGSITLSVAKRHEGTTVNPSTPTTLFIIARNIISVSAADEVKYIWQVSGMSAQGA